MTKRLMLLLLAAVLFHACADTNSNSRYRSRDALDRASTCATCGATVSDNYFAGSAFKAVGPGNY
jgi:nitrous oxide reductase accessory protein NosL